MSIRGIAVISATAVTAVGSAVGVASSTTAHGSNAEAKPLETTVLTDIPGAQQFHAQTASVSEQADTLAFAAADASKKIAEEAARKHAAEEAIAKKAAAEDAAKEQREKAELAASRTAERTTAPPALQTSYTVAEIQAIARQMVAADQYQCMSYIVDHESGWNYRAVNPSSGAYGLFQALPGSKMSSAGSDWRENPRTQIKWGLNYMNERYGNACSAWEFWQANNWY